MYFQNYTPPQTHLAPAETNPAFGAYELQGMGANDESSAIGAVAGLALAATPLMVGYGVYKRGHGLGWTAGAAVGTGVGMIPAFLILMFVPGGFLIPPLLAGLYAFKD
jgi:hypothetical protein